VPAHGIVTLGRQLQSLDATCPAAQDVIFVVDASGSMMTGKIWEEAKAFVEGMIDGLLIPPSHVGVIRYEDEVKKISDFDDDRDAVKDRINKSLVFSDGETELGPPLKMAHEMFVGANATKGAARTVVIVTDGNPNDWVQTQIQADRLKAYNARLMSVIFGDHRPGEKDVVRQIVSDPFRDFIVVADYESVSLLTAATLDTMYISCPCDAGLSTTLKIDYNVINVSIATRLEHNSIRRQPCDKYISDYQGLIELRCQDLGNHTSVLIANHSCIETCEAGDRVLVIHDGVQTFACQNRTVCAPCQSPEEEGLPNPNIWLIVIIIVLIIVYFFPFWKKKKINHEVQIQTMGLEHNTLSLQTDNWMFFELKGGSQLPLDVVFCVDSSSSVTETGFSQAKDFLVQTIQHFECPIVQAGLIQFNDKSNPFPFEIPITCDQVELLKQIQSMEYKIGGSVFVALWQLITLTTVH
jgi:uncharacterized protein YegL